MTASGSDLIEQFPPVLDMNTTRRRLMHSIARTSTIRLLKLWCESELMEFREADTAPTRTIGRHALGSRGHWDRGAKRFCARARYPRRPAGTHGPCCRAIAAQPACVPAH